MTAAVVPVEETTAPAKPKGFNGKDWRTIRFAMRKVAGSLSHRGNVTRCGMPLGTIETDLDVVDFLDFKAKPGLGDVRLCRHGRRATFDNVRTCGSVWECPICSDRSARDAGEELRLVCQENRRRGGWNYSGAFTIRHGVMMRLETGIGAIVLAWRKTIAGAPWKRICDRYGIIGYVRTPEITYGKNGWHPHLHAGFFAARRLSEAEEATVQEWLSIRWRKMLIKQGLDENVTPTLAAGVKFGTMQKDDYLAKYGLGGELAKGHLKNARDEESRTPWEILLGLTLGTAKPRDRWLWREYTAAMYRHKQLTWSKRLRAHFDVDRLVEEERAREAAELNEDPEEPTVLAEIDPHVYLRHIWREATESELLDLAERGASAQIIDGWFRRRTGVDFRGRRYIGNRDGPNDRRASQPFLDGFGLDVGRRALAAVDGGL